MSSHQRFCFADREELGAKIASLGLDLPLDADLSPLGRSLKIGNREVPNSLAVHPLECRDSTPDGSPSELTFRRYRRFAEGGAGQIWFEATSFTEEGRSDKSQLLLNEKTLRDFSKLCEDTKQAGTAAHGMGRQPMTVLELTHSGRHSARRPVIAVHDPVLDQASRVVADDPLITDAELEELEERYVDAARLAAQAGFDAVDIKACHGYLVAELLGAQERPGRYGGSFENRTRFFFNVIDKIQSRLGSALAITSRLNACEGIPGGWGMHPDGELRADLDEPIRLVKMLYERGVRFVNISAGNPYINPHIGRPFDRPMEGSPYPEEHPLEGVARLVGQVRQIQQAVPEMIVIGTGYSWLRQYLGYSAAANIRRGWVSMVGLGREALAYPDFARDLLEKGQLDRRKTCVTCSLCSQLMRAGGPAGCVIYDREIYRPVYRNMSRKAG
jgi:2,4-dienoyl-CoA reductase (NADPH2)